MFSAVCNRRGGRAAGALALALAAGTALAGPDAGAAAPPPPDVRQVLQTAARLYESLDYEKALDELKRARTLSPGPDDEVEILLYEGIVHADMSHREPSQAAFRAALQLRWDARLPVKVSPKVERDFEQLRKQVVQEQARARRTQGGHAAAQQAGLPSGTAAPSDRPTAAPPPQATASLVPAPAPPPAAPALELFGARVPMVPAALGGAAALAGVGGAVFGLISQNALAQARQATYQDEAYARWQDASRAAPVANTLFVTAGVLAGGAVATYLLLPQR